LTSRSDSKVGLGVDRSPSNLNKVGLGADLDLVPQVKVGLSADLDLSAYRLPRLSGCRLRRL
jgi:hypothetical protein